ncbi:MAG: hypothetical protein U0Q18_01565 [Bryobacteraceae bacterium]
MNPRPIYVTIIGWLYIAVGIIGFAYHATEVKAIYPVAYDFIAIEVIRLLAVVAGIYLLRGRNWARWLTLAWMAFHVIVSAFHTWPEMALHALFCAILAYLLFRPAARGYFHPSET